MPFTSLPVEMLHIIIEHLDLISIFNFSLTNHTIHAQIQSHTIYQVLTTDRATLSAIKILSQTSLLHNHTLSTLSSTLHAETCSCCHRDQAQYLSLPLGTRACFTCLHDCPQFQLIPMGLASSTFGVPETTFASVTLHTVPGMYQTKGGFYKCAYSVPLVNVMQARDLTVQIMGTSSLDQHMASRNVDFMMYKAPIAARVTFATPYTDISLDACAVGPRGEWLMKVRDREVVTGERVGLAVMGCELWPKMTKRMGFLLDEGSVARWLMRNDYQPKRR